MILRATQLADAADRVRMDAGQYVFWSLLALLAALAASPFVLHFTLPKPLQPPETKDAPGYAQYLTQVLAEMQRNPQLAGTTLATPEDIETAMRVLSAKVDKSALNAASATFVSTAMMQNGRLDGLLVLAAQFRLVLQITAFYHMRPKLRQVMYVYSNVGAAVLIASSIDDIDFAEIASPIVTAAAPALAGGVRVSRDCRACSSTAWPAALPTRSSPLGWRCSPSTIARPWCSPKVPRSARARRSPRSPCWGWSRGTAVHVW